MSGSEWDELRLSEEPADELLRRLGYSFIAPEAIDDDRDGASDAVLTKRAIAAVKKLNPWISDVNARRAVRELSHITAPGLIEANERAYNLLVYGATVEQDVGAGKQGQTVRYIDFGDPLGNDLAFTRQFRVKGAKRDVIADIAVFVNGIPVAVIECKSPTIRDPLDAGVKQLLRYQELGDEWRGLGAPRLFHTAQILVAACGVRALCATVGSTGRHYAEWKVPHPLAVDRLEGLLGREVQGQDILLAGMLAPRNLLDLVQNFVVFETESGITVKKLARYQQYVAVDLAMQRVAGEEGARRGGVIWHTQGSGKSLTMVFLAVKLRRFDGAENPTIVVVTDRRDLDHQIAETFARCGFPNPTLAPAIHDRRDANGNVLEPGLRSLLRGPTGKTVMTTIQKFQEASDAKHPVLNTASNIFVMVDEAHRSQYQGLAANMRRALPMACFFGFTGTPIEKNDRNTPRTFGGTLHRYTIEQAVADGATVPILYEMRASKDRVEGEPLDRVFDRVFRDRSDKEREAIKSKYATLEAIASAPQRITRICEDLIEHFETTIAPNGFKAQVVACNREVAALYKETLDRLGGPDSALIMSSTNNDPEHIARWHRTPRQQKQYIDDFKKRDHPLKILVVCDMLLTGFDAPIEQVMYLDAPLREHTLLQAIARVNRTADGKDYGLIVDYWGVAEHLEDALAVFAREDVAGAMRPKTDELPRLQARHRTVMRFFGRVDHDDPDACLRVIEPEDVRAEFDLAFRRFTQSLDVLLPDPAALEYLADLRWLGKVRNLARERFRDEQLDLSGCREKVRQLIEDYIRSDGVELILAPVPILSKEFEEQVAALGSDEARASEMEHAIRHEVNVKLDENPAFFEALSKRLQQIIDDRRAARIDAAEALRRLQGVLDEIRAVRQTAASLGLDEDGFAFYELLGRIEADREPLLAAEPPGPAYGSGDTETLQVDPHRRDLARAVLEALRSLVVVDWTTKEDVQRRMRQAIKTLLSGAGYGRAQRDVAAQELIDLARVRLG
ncbi:MAG: type I restriction endonuclease subunit R [Alphaproteobacteria bacterium]|nr:type I restriction endonuclease subunit R [Alphaproteobacteria bacterium]